MTLVWFLDMMLYLTFLFDPTAYHARVAAGAACWVQADATYMPTMGLGDRGAVQPACPYDPTNTNDGHFATRHMPASKGALRAR